ncbi:MAG TPA: LLM class flavin-dependent oxidoreductase [Nakamurella sp.]|nr:LLM class flavin-dependent oxidoreductase [Nakamurella sp.]
MPDLGHEVSFGIFLPNPASQAATVVRLAQLAEDQGLDLIGIQDHPYNPDLLDTWTLLSHLAAATERVRLFPGVTCLPLRPAAVLARSAASLDLLSRGRVELGLGAGLFLDPIAGMGAPPLTRGQSVDALAEAIGVIRALWNATEPVTLPGKFHHLQGAAPGPRPDHDIGIWVGSYGRRMLELTARLADGWVPSQGYAGPDEVAALTVRLDDLIIDAGRDPGDLVRIYNINGRFAAGGHGFLDGSPAVWAEQLTELVLLQGFSGFVLAPSGDIIASIGTFAEQVVPDVRERVARERAGGASGAGTDGRAGAGASSESMVASGLSGVGPRSDGPAVVAERPLERDGNWGHSGGLPVTQRPRAQVAQGVDGVPNPGLPNPGGRDNHRNLVAVHDHLRSEMVQILQAVSQVSAGELAPGEARSLISRMTVRQNHWTLGSFCASYCRIVTIHHTVEDGHMFPALQEVEPSLGPVLERLGAEHEVIADVLDKFDRALVDLVREQDGAGVPGRSGAAGIAALAAELNDLLLSHLAYEEDELADGLARMPAPI